MNFINSTKLLDLPKIHDSRGNLSIIESNINIPFEIKRVYWIFDVPGGEIRGGHAYKESEEFIVALSGSFDIVIRIGDQFQRINLSRSYYGIYIPKMTWRSLENFSTNSLALILASTEYKEDDYIRDYVTYLNILESCG